MYGEKIVKVQDFALETGCPLVGINEGGGARIQEGVVSLGLYVRSSPQHVASGVIPQISVIMGAAAGGHVYSPALTDFIVMVDKTSQMFITGPDVVRTVTGEDVALEELGGARTHNTTSGNAHYLAADEPDAIEYVGAAVLPAVRTISTRAPGYDTDTESPKMTTTLLDSVIPDSANQPYDMHEVITRLLDEGDFCEVQALFAPNILVGFGRVEGYPSASWPTSRPSLPAAWTSTPPRRRPDSSAPAMRSTSRSSPWSTYRGSCPASARNTTASSGAGPN